MATSDEGGAFPELVRLASACASDADFRRTFGSEESCREWFLAARKQTFICTQCSSNHWLWVDGARPFLCCRCGRRQSITAGTLLHGTRKPFLKWFEAIYLIVQRGVNARTLQRELGLTYKIAWLWAHKLRDALTPVVVPPEPAAHERLHLAASRVARDTYEWPPEGERPCGCARLLASDFGFGDPAVEARRQRLAVWDAWLEGREEKFEDPPPPRHWSSCKDIFVTYAGSVSAKHLGTYMEEASFRLNWSRRAIGDAFGAVADVATWRRAPTYRGIVGRRRGEVRPLSIFAGVLVDEREGPI
jgi:transposase-like protein